MQYSSKSTYKGTRIKLTSDAKGPCTLSFEGSKTFTDSFSSTISGSLTLKEMFIAEVEVSVGVSWTSSASISYKQNISYSIPSGKTGAIYFTPYYIQYNCTYFNNSGYASSVYGRSPKKTATGFNDGLFEVVYK